MTEAHNMKRITSATITCEVSPTLLTQYTSHDLPPPQALRFSHKARERKMRGTGDEAQGTKRRRKKRGETRSYPFPPSGLPFCTNFHRERELLSVPAGNHERVEVDVLGIIVEDMYQRVLSLQNAYFFLYFM